VTYAGPVHLILAGRVVADSSSNSPSGALGLVVFLVLLVGCIFLFRSMAGRIKRLPTSFEPPDESASDATVDVLADPVRPADSDPGQ
jgi:hypothetical protein